MGLMKPEMIFGDWFTIEAREGTLYIPTDLVVPDTLDAGKILDATRDKVKADLEHTLGYRIKELDITEGYGIRLNAPGYMDRTDWEVYDTEVEAFSAFEDNWDYIPLIDHGKVIELLVEEDLLVIVVRLFSKWYARDVFLDSVNDSEAYLIDVVLNGFKGFRDLSAVELFGKIAQFGYLERMEAWRNEMAIEGGLIEVHTV